VWVGSSWVGLDIAPAVEAVVEFGGSGSGLNPSFHEGEHADHDEHRSRDEQDLVPAALVRDERHTPSVRGRSCVSTPASG